MTVWHVPSLHWRGIDTVPIVVVAVLSFRRIGTLGKENSISADDMQRLKSIERIKDYGEASFFPVLGGRL